MQNVSAKDIDASKPKYLIIFQKPSEKNTTLLSSVMKKGKSKNFSEGAGLTMLAPGETGVSTKIYESLGIAAADLTKEEITELKKKDAVLEIVENEVRYLPPVRVLTNNPEKTATGDKSQMLAYLKGIRDAANLAIAFHSGEKAEITGSVRENSQILKSQAGISWCLEMIGIGSSSLTGKGVKVAVLDTGIDFNHPDLRNRVIDGVTAKSFVKASPVTVQDVNGHGTHCAGIIAGPLQSVSDLRYGVAPNAELLVGKVFNNALRPRATDDDILDGIYWADEQGAKIISMSLGSIRGVGDNAAIQYEQIAQELLNRAENSILLIAAAGNESDRPFSTAPVGNPAACASVMSVAAVDEDRTIADFSCSQMDEIGDIDVSAPGVGVYSSYRNGTFRRLSGTSMATPHVAGLAALYLERDPTLTAKQLFDLLQSNAFALGNPEDFGSGLIQL